ncbi:WD40 repeat domain-containing protein [Bacillus sp. FJAT-45037]|uniref:WD40 repeat domain-containing protein n=1 Tax=Bacillus sp. FJAT-45037 TaxID=2011007 RepID=UPI000C24427C|nr:WD40 repeat domain-containing protein [Bacillus sp. FJAT-45037]
MDRITKIAYIANRDCLLCSDIRGRVHYLDRWLNLLKSSPSTAYTNMINAITFTEEFIFTRDIKGVIGKWDADTLHPLDFHDDYSLRENEYLESLDEESSPSLARGIAAFNGKLYTTNGYAQFVVLDQDTFNVIKIYPPFNELSFVDGICVENADIQAISETCGMLHLGNIETHDFSKKISIDSGNVHIIRYDKKNSRFIATQDYGLDEDKNVRNGIVTLDMKTYEKKEYHFTTDDVEFLQFSDDYTLVIAGGFDGKVHIYDNNESELKLKKILGPFRHQLIGGSTIEDDLYLLMQSGELIRTDLEGRIKDELDFDYKCVWSIESHPTESNLIYCATGKGVKGYRFEDAPYNSVNFTLEFENNHSLGITFRVVPLNDGSYIGLTRKNIIFRSNEQGEILWHNTVEDLPKNVAVNAENQFCLLGLDNGKVYELDVEKGKIVRTTKLNAPVYVLAYRENGEKVIGTKPGDFIICDTELNVLREFALDGYPKRMMNFGEKEFVVGSFGLVELNLDQGEAVNTYTELLWNTKENGSLLGEYSFVISYGKQIGVYKQGTEEMVGLVEPLYDFPKGMLGIESQQDHDILLVGGNGGFINVYRIVDGSPIKVRELYV